MSGIRIRTDCSIRLAWTCAISRLRRHRSARSLAGPFRTSGASALSTSKRLGGRCARTPKARWLARRASTELEAFDWPTPDCIDRSQLKGQCRRYEDYALLYGFADIWQRPALVRGWEEMFVDMAERPEWVHFLCRKFTDFYLEDYTRAAELTGGRIDLYLVISDLGSQHGPLISLAMFRQFVAPYLKEMIERIHSLGGRAMYP